jgi:hypothetical protein
MPRKQAKAGQSIAAPIKSVRPPAATDFEKLTPAWRFSRLELVDPFGWHQIATSKLHEIRERLASFESMTWHEILVANNHANHSIKISKICRTARQRLEELKLEDIEDLVSLRVSGKERVWGIKQDNILLLLWWDPQHQICPSKKRHT